MHGPPRSHLPPAARAGLAALGVLAVGALVALSAPARGPAALAAGAVAAGAVGGLVLWAVQDRALRQRAAALVQQLRAARREADAEAARLREALHSARLDVERAERSRDEFVATVSHELRTPLNAVLGWARLLRLGKLDAAGVAKAVQTIERSASAQAQIVDDVLDVARIMRGELRVGLQEVELLDVVDAAVDAVRPAATARHISIDTAFDPGAGHVVGDPARLRQVVWNLVSNAVKFTPTGGRVEVRLERGGQHALVRVQDTGIGIEKAFLPHLFERFRQADSSSTRAHGGLGLGLALVRLLVEAHGGSIDAESPGRGLGATFTVRLPIPSPAQRGRVRGVAAAERPSSPEPWPLAQLDGLRVLVVDDDADSREVVREVLEQAGAEVFTAASAREALAAFSASPPDVLLSDLGMPEQDGYDLIRRVRALGVAQGGQVPAAALTAYTQAEDRRAAVVAGYEGYLSKPIDPAELTTAVARLAGRVH
jgi:signal transduction histidine kinase/ActR/RegA family two-component response regulator